MSRSFLTCFFGRFITPANFDVALEESPFYNKVDQATALETFTLCFSLKIEGSYQAISNRTVNQKIFPFADCLFKLEENAC